MFACCVRLLDPPLPVCMVRPLSPGSERIPLLCTKLYAIIACMQIIRFDRGLHTSRHPAMIPPSCHSAVPPSCHPAILPFCPPAIPPSQGCLLASALASTHSSCPCLIASAPAVHKLAVRPPPTPSKTAYAKHRQIHAHAPTLLLCCQDVHS